MKSPSRIIYFEIFEKKFPTAANINLFLALLPYLTLSDFYHLSLAVGTFGIEILNSEIIWKKLYIHRFHNSKKFLKEYEQEEFVLSWKNEYQLAHFRAELWYERSSDYFYLKKMSEEINYGIKKIQKNLAEVDSAFISKTTKFIDALHAYENNKDNIITPEKYRFLIHLINDFFTAKQKALFVLQISLHEDSKKQLIYSIELGQKSLIKHILQEQFKILFKNRDYQISAWVNSPDDYGRMPLFYAARNGNKKIIDLLIEYQANISKCDNEDNHILHVLVKYQHHELFKLYQLLNNIPSKNLKTLINKNDDNLLHMAAFSGNEILGEELLNYDFDINQKNKQGLTVAETAVLHGRVEFLKLLLNRFFLQLSDKNYYFHYAVKYNQPDVINILNVRKIFVNYVYENKTPFELALSKITLLSPRIFQTLINNGVDIKELDREGNTLLHYVCLHSPYFRLIHLLLAHIKNSSDFLMLENIINLKNKSGLTPYMLAIQSESWSLLAIFVAFKSNQAINCSNVENLKKALEMAFIEHDIDSLPYLLKKAHYYSSYCKKLIDFFSVENKRIADCLIYYPFFITPTMTWKDMVTILESLATKPFKLTQFMMLKSREDNEFLQKLKLLAEPDWRFEEIKIPSLINALGDLLDKFSHSAVSQTIIDRVKWMRIELSEKNCLFFTSEINQYNLKLAMYEKKEALRSPKPSREKSEVNEDSESAAKTVDFSAKF